MPSTILCHKIDFFMKSVVFVVDHAFLYFSLYNFSIICYLGGNDYSNEEVGNEPKKYLVIRPWLWRRWQLRK